jgi:hypothetical protein
MINIYDYHWIWYILGFLFAPRMTLAILACLYLPIVMSIKIIILILGCCINISIGDNND